MQSQVHFDVWGCRGSRNLVPARSRVGNNTSCYSVLTGEDLVVLDAGRGLAALGHAIPTQPRFASLKRVHVLVTHAHMDHWEGLKDADWFWRRNNGLKIRILGTPQALDAIRSGYAHPSYVPLDILAIGTVGGLEYIPIKSGEERRIKPWTVKTAPLNHYSGDEHSRHVLNTLGFRLSKKGGPTIVYLSDHEPTEQTRAMEESMVHGATLVVYDSQFPDVWQHAHGHGSQEHAAGMARSHPDVHILAGHLGPMLTDLELKQACQRHGRKLANFALAVEGTTYIWDSAHGAFQKVKSAA